jgi:hypothetical protein
LKREDDFEKLLRHDLHYLRCIIARVVELSPLKTSEDRDTLGVLRDYLVWLTFDAITDEKLARRLVHIMVKLQEELHAEAENNHTRDIDPTAPAFYEGFLHGLEQSISFSHGVDLLLDEEIDREEFEMIWRQAKERLGL